MKIPEVPLTALWSLPAGVRWDGVRMVECRPSLSLPSPHFRLPHGFWTFHKKCTTSIHFTRSCVTFSIVLHSSWRLLKDSERLLLLWWCRGPALAVDAMPDLSLLCCYCCEADPSVTVRPMFCWSLHFSAVSQHNDIWNNDIQQLETRINNCWCSGGRINMIWIRNKE